jgi:hypothetical protein
MSLYIHINNIKSNLYQINNATSINSLSHFSHFGQTYLVMLII